MINPRDIRNRAGQSLIESCLAMALLCLLFMGLFQVSQLIGARQVLYHAAARGARAKTVGFNRFMVQKTIRVAAIPNAGRMVEPEMDSEDAPLRAVLAGSPVGTVWDHALQTGAEPSGIHEVERARIPAFLGAPYWAWAFQVLDYAHWDQIHGSVPSWVEDGQMLDVRVRQTLDLRRLFGAALHRAFYASDTLDIQGHSRLEAHYPLYIEDRNW